MASPRIAQQFAPPKPPIPGQGQNVALEALSEAADRQVQRDQITAQMQMEAMRSNVDAAKMQVAAASDLGRGITEASQAFATQAENKRRTDIAVAEAQKSREAQTERDRTAQASAERIQADHDEVNRVNDDATRTLDREEKALDRKAVKDVDTARRLHIQADNLLARLADPTGVPEDAVGAEAYTTDIELQYAEIQEQLVALGEGQSKDMLSRGFNIMAASSLARRTTLLGKKELALRKKKSTAAREQALHMKASQLKVQNPRFEQMEVWRLIDPGRGSGKSVHERAVDLLMTLSQGDLSNPKPGGRGVGLVQALAMNEGKPANLLNQVAAKLGPHGMATADSLSLTIQTFHSALGETDDPLVRADRRAVILEMGGMAASLQRLPAISAIQNGYAMDVYGTWFNTFREDEGRPPTAQESHNHIRGIDASHLPGNLDIGKLFAAPFAGETQFGVPTTGEPGTLVAPEQQAEALSAPPVPTGAPQSPTGRQIGLRGIGQSAVRAVQALTNIPGKDKLQIPRGPFRP